MKEEKQNQEQPIAYTGKGVGERNKLIADVIEKCASLCSDPIDYLKIKSLTPNDFI
jgi:hypothetical protein